MENCFSIAISFLKTAGLAQRGGDGAERGGAGPTSVPGSAESIFFLGASESSGCISDTLPQHEAAESEDLEDPFSSDVC